MLLNDTAHYRGSHQLTIKNNGNSTITYTLEHTPAGTASTVHASNQTMIEGNLIQPTSSPASVSIQPSTLTVPAGQAGSVNVTIQPPSGLDAKSFPVFSGYVVAKGSDNSTLRSTYLGVAAVLNDMRVIETLRPPQIVDKRSNEKKSFAMQGDDVPHVAYHLVGGTTKLLIDLVNSSSTATPDSSSSTQPKSSDEYSSPGHIGRVLSRSYATRAFIGRSGEPFTTFTDNTTITDGRYVVLMRALKINGDPNNANDWESWRSEPFAVESGFGVTPK